MEKKPNILILFSDEHRSDVMGFSDKEKISRTPFLDWLSKDGIVFENCYTPSPICVPSRQCIMSGKYPKTCDCNGWVGLKSDVLTYAQHLSNNGYKAVGFGKMHMIGDNPLAGFSSRPIGDVDVPLRVKNKQNLDDDNLNCPGLKKWSDEKEMLKAGPGKSNWKDEASTNYACNWIDENLIGTYYDREDIDTPLLLFLGLNEPHYPYFCKEELFKYYLPRVTKPKGEKSSHPFLGRNAWPSTCDVGVSNRTAIRAKSAYYSMVENMDSNFEKFIESLKLANQDLDDWIIVYLSDHGEMLGDHGVWEKQKFYEASVKVPFIIRAPKYLKAQGIHIKSNVSSCDLFPTLCDLINIPIPKDIDGKSLLPLLENEEKDRKVYSFFLQQGYFNVMIKQNNLKYQHYEHAEKGVMQDVLFDLEKDNGENINYVSCSEYKEKIMEFKKDVEVWRVK